MIFYYNERIHERIGATIEDVNRMRGIFLELNCDERILANELKK